MESFAQVCDVNCKCDTDCSSTELSTVFSTEWGVPEQVTSAASPVPRCLDRDLFLRINAEVLSPPRTNRTRRVPPAW